MSNRTLLNIGYGNLVMASRVIAIVAPGAAPMKRLRDEAAKHNKLVDSTQGRRTRSIIMMDSDHVILSAINPETIAARFAAEESEALDPPQAGEAGAQRAQVARSPQGREAAAQRGEAERSASPREKEASKDHPVGERSRTGGLR